MRHFISKIILLDGWQRLGLAFLAGAVASFGQPPLGWFPLLWISLPTLIFCLDSASLGKTPMAAAVSMARVGWVFGFGFFLLTFYWLGAAFLVEADKFAWAMPLAVVILPSGLALFWAAACGVLGALWSSSVLRIVWLALSFAAFEWLRGSVFTGLPWGGFGFVLASNGIMMQMLALVGPDTMTLLAVLIFCLPALAISEADEIGLSKRLALGIAVLFILQLSYGAWRIGVPEPTDDQAPVVRLVQPNIPQTEKWKFENRSWIFNRLLALTTLEAPDAPTEDVDLVVWPESAVPFYLIEQPGALAAIAQALPPKAGLVTGALRRVQSIEGEEEVFNSVYRLGADGTVLDAYDKVHLVPFGEYLPFSPLLSMLGMEQLTAQRKGFASGGKRKLIDGGTLGSMLPLVCYEIAFSSEILDYPKDADWIVNVTNDAWFGATAGPWQHLHLARMRAVELGLPVVRVANTGISAIIDSRGRIVQALGVEEEGIVQAMLPKKSSKTLYSIAGNWFFFIIWAIFGLTTLGIRRKVN